MEADGLGYLIATIAAIQGALYLVLSVNAAIAISRGLAAAPGELPIWGPLTICTAIAAILLLRNGSGAFRHPPQPRDSSSLGAGYRVHPHRLHLSVGWVRACSRFHRSETTVATATPQGAGR